jgi:hypothetical protein
VYVLEAFCDNGGGGIVRLSVINNVLSRLTSVNVDCTCECTCEVDAVPGTSCAPPPIVALGSLAMNEGATAAGARVSSAGITGRGLGFESVGRAEVALKCVAPTAVGALPLDPRFRVAIVTAQTEGK